MCLAIPGRVETLEERSALERQGQVAFGEVRKTINLAFVPEAQVGDYVLVHVGVAISRIDEEEAAEVFRYLEEIGDLEELKEPAG